MQENTKPLVFGYPLWNKIVFLLLATTFLGINIRINIIAAIGYFKCNNLHEFFINIEWAIVLFLVFDFCVCKLLAKITITPSELIYNPGGFVWKWFFRRRLLWKDYKFYLHYWIDVLPSSKHLYSYTTICAVEKKSNKVRFKLYSRYSEYMKGIVEAIEHSCSDSERVRDYKFWDWLDDKFDR